MRQANRYDIARLTTHGSAEGERHAARPPTQLRNVSVPKPKPGATSPIVGTSASSILRPATATQAPPPRLSGKPGPNTAGWPELGGPKRNVQQKTPGEKFQSPPGAARLSSRARSCKSIARGW